MQKLITACFDLVNAPDNAHRKLRKAMNEQGWGSSLEGSRNEQYMVTEGNEGVWMWAVITDTTMALNHEGPEEPVKKLAERYTYEWQRMFEKFKLEGKVFVTVSDTDGWSNAIIRTEMYDKID